MTFNFCLWFMVSVCSIICCSAQENVERGNTINETCAHKCDECYITSDTLRRMECIQECKRVGVSFTCPSNQICLDNAKEVRREIRADGDENAQKLRDELDKINKKRASFVKQRDIQQIMEMYTEDSMYLINGMVPGFGRQALGDAFTDWLTANPKIDHATYNSVRFGEIEGKDMVWDNGEMKAYDDSGDLLGTFSFMILYKKINGELQQYMDALF